MKDNESVQISADIAANADVYHTQEHCQTIQKCALTNITYYTARQHNLEKCGNCRHLERGGGFADTPARRLAEMEPDDLLGGGSA